MSTDRTTTLVLTAGLMAAGAMAYFPIAEPEPVKAANPFEGGWQPGHCRHLSVNVGTPGNRCGWRKRSDQKKSDRQARMKKHRKRINPGSRRRRYW